MAEILTSQVVSGLATGCVYALIALGFVLIFKATDVVNFAQGEFVMVSGFISYTLLVWFGLPYWVVLLATIVLSGFMGVGLERLVVRPIMDAPIFSIVIATIGASIVLRSSAGIVYGYDVLPLPTIFSKDPIRLGVLSFTAMDAGVIGSSLAIMLANPPASTGLSMTTPISVLPTAERPSMLADPTSRRSRSTIATLA